MWNTTLSESKVQSTTSIIHLDLAAPFRNRDGDGRTKCDIVVAVVVPMFNGT
jgi:hypothetical protein